MPESLRQATTSPARPAVEIFTDGACSGNPGPGGWGAILRSRGVEKELSGGEPATTNNRMELMAAIAALEALKRPCRVRLYTDSQYLRDGITRWLPVWKARGWRTAGKTPVKNVDLWQRLEAAAAPHRIDTEGLRSANALVAWLDGAMVDDGTACEIGMFAELVRSESARYRGIVAIATDLRLERRRRQDVVGGGMNLFVGGAIESCGKIVHAVDEVVAALREL